jgi:hypothetical protein
MGWVVALVTLAGCAQSSGAPGQFDLTVALPPDLGLALDGAAPTVCNPVDPLSDNTPCANGCGVGTVGVTQNGACSCLMTCDPAYPTECPCDRRCAALVRGDAGMVGGACLFANGPGERCGVPGSATNSGRGCAQGTYCVAIDEADTLRYCSYDCGSTPCPAQLLCLTLTDPATGQPAGRACVSSARPNGKTAGSPCAPTGLPADACLTGLLCDGTCKPECDGPGAACASGTCTRLTFGTRIVGYVCK